ncbi:geranylgeranyl pyrophosphate synthase, partial [Sulfolobus sp. A20-N-G8]
RVANIIKYYSLDYAYNLAEMYSKKAIESISRIKSRNQTAEKALKYLAEFTIKRRK